MSVLLLVPLWTACAKIETPPLDSSDPTDDSDPTGEDSDDGDETGDSKTDTTDTGDPPVVITECPEGMSPVGADLEHPDFCIDTWETVATGALGSLDPWAEDAVPTTATATSSPGVVPTVPLSFMQARAICANTPVLDAKGEVVGHKHLVTPEQWQDAADGVVGEGGTLWPWGDEPVDGRCALPYQDGTVWLPELQPTGSYPDCVSAFGVYDQIGNAWEWTDPRVDMDPEAWGERAAEDGRLEISGETVLVRDMSVLAELSFQGMGLLPVVFHTGEGGLLYFRAEASSWSAEYEGKKGYVVWTLDGSPDYPAEDLPQSWLPVDIHAAGEAEADGTVPLTVTVLVEMAGRPFADKRGGAWYTGADVDLTQASYYHNYADEVTVNPRCAWGG